jgi:hypothetical protein
LEVQPKRGLHPEQALESQGRVRHHVAFAVHQVVDSWIRRPPTSRPTWPGSGPAASENAPAASRQDRGCAMRREPYHPVSPCSHVPSVVVRDLRSLRSLLRPDRSPGPGQSYYNESRYICSSPHFARFAPSRQPRRRTKAELTTSCPDRLAARRYQAQPP